MIEIDFTLFPHVIIFYGSKSLFFNYDVKVMSRLGNQEEKYISFVPACYFSFFKCRKLNFDNIDC